MSLLMDSYFLAHQRLSPENNIVLTGLHYCSFLKIKRRAENWKWCVGIYPRPKVAGDLSFPDNRPKGVRNEHQFTLVGGEVLINCTSHISLHP